MAKDPRQFLRGFIDEVLSGEIEKFRSFDFKQLKDNDKYGCPGRNFDCDDSEIIRAVYVVLWGELLPGLRMDNFGYRKQYRGDTMNTFHTMFGRETEEKPGSFAGLEKYAPSDELREKVRHFGRTYTVLGNYTVLPNFYARQTTLNCYRGTNKWHDFFDIFLAELRKVLTGAGDQDDTLKELVQVNSFCFRNFQGEDGVKRLVDGLFLNGYCCENTSQVRQIFSMNHHWKDVSARERYLEDAEHYLENAGKIISSRTEKMLCALKEKLASPRA